VPGIVTLARRSSVKYMVSVSLLDGLSTCWLERMEKVVVATFGSPSAVRAWARCTTHRPTCACIGETSQHAAMLSGFGEIYAPSQPSLVEWAEATVKAVLTKFNHSADAYQQLAI